MRLRKSSLVLFAFSSLLGTAAFADTAALDTTVAPTSANLAGFWQADFQDSTIQVFFESNGSFEKRSQATADGLKNGYHLFGSWKIENRRIFLTPDMNRCAVETAGQVKVCGAEFEPEVVAMAKDGVVSLYRTEGFGNGFVEGGVYADFIDGSKAFTNKSRVGLTGIHAALDSRGRAGIQGPKVVWARGKASGPVAGFDLTGRGGKTWLAAAPRVLIANASKSEGR